MIAYGGSAEVSTTIAGGANGTTFGASEGGIPCSMTIMFSDGNRTRSWFATAASVETVVSTVAHPPRLSSMRE